jgi:hypothetical protein
MNTKTYYYSTDSGEIVCQGCAGMHLAHMLKVNPNAQEFEGAQDTYYPASGDQVGVLRSVMGSDALCYCETGTR